MKTTITKFEFKKITTENFEVELPETQLFFWHNGIRKAYSVTPVWTTWLAAANNKPEEIYEYKVLCVDPTNISIEAFTIRVSSISEILQKSTNPLHRLVENFVYYPTEGVRAKEWFLADYENVLNKLKGFLEYE